MLHEQFHEVFAGLTRAYGKYTIGDNSNIKVEGTAKTISEPYTSKLWELHLTGKLGLGVGVGAATVEASPFDPAEESTTELGTDVTDKTSVELTLDSIVETETFSAGGISTVSEELQPTSNINKKPAVKICLIIFKSQPESHN